MNTAPPSTDVVQVTTTSGTFYSWVDTPTTVALVFALAGAIFIGIYCLRRIRNRTAERKG
jgi:flagellar biogenesis protein FliO